MIHVRIVTKGGAVIEDVMPSNTNEEQLKASEMNEGIVNMFRDPESLRHPFIIQVNSWVIDATTIAAFSMIEDGVKDEPDETEDPEEQYREDELNGTLDHLRKGDTHEPKKRTRKARA